jgi:hypothetical protein
MNQHDPRPVTWELVELGSPHLDRPVAVVAARDIPYLPTSNRFQNLSIYLRRTQETAALIGRPATALPGAVTRSAAPACHVHIHGGAWRDPQLTSASIEPAAAHVLSAGEDETSIAAIASINYTVSKFPTHPTLPYDPIKDNHTDPAREAVHPQHVSDVLNAFALLVAFGLTDGSYVLSGHSCGACLAFQATLQPPTHYGLDHLGDAPGPAALLGLNGLYDLPELVSGLGPSHEHLRDDYEMFLSNAFGADQRTWPAASPARFDPAAMVQRVRAGHAPPLVVLDQSAEDQLVPMRQRELLASRLREVDGLQVVEGHRLSGRHAAPWEEGVMIWESLQDVLALLAQARDEPAAS